jgi:uncharacterized protein YhbP (UPF0306 family)
VSDSATPLHRFVDVPLTDDVDPGGTSVIDRSGVERVLAANRYLVLGTADEHGQPWATPLFFAPLGATRLCWVSGPDSRHSRNIAHRSAVAITVFDSTVDVGRGEAAYFDADAAPASPEETDAALQALNARLPEHQQLCVADLQPRGPMVVYRAHLRRWYVLVRGCTAEAGNELDMTVEV